MSPPLAAVLRAAPALAAALALVGGCSDPPAAPPDARADAEPAADAADARADRGADAPDVGDGDAALDADAALDVARDAPLDLPVPEAAVCGAALDVTVMRSPDGLAPDVVEECLPPRRPLDAGPPCPDNGEERCVCADGLAGVRYCRDDRQWGACRCGGVDAGLDGTIGTDAPPPVRTEARLLAPLSGARATSQRPSFRWVQPAGVTRARVELCEDRPCTRMRMQGEVAGTSWRPAERLPPGVTFWRVRGLRGDGSFAWASPTWEVGIRHRDLDVDTSYGVIHDFNGDGFDDPVIGRGYSRAYKLRVYTGGADGVRADRFRGLNPPFPDWDNREVFGETFAGGDLNGDGLTDLVVSTPSFRAPGEVLGSGRVFTYPGARDRVLSSCQAPMGGSRPGFLSADGERGLSVGDFNGDGYGDVLVTSQSFREPVRLHLGGPEGVDEFPVDGTNAVDYTARFVGDINGDGYQDVVARTGPSLSESTVVVLFGNPLGRLLLHVQGPFRQRLTYDEYGFETQWGDFNGDGYSDAAISGGGYVDLYHGSPAGLTLATRILTPPFTAFGAITPGNAFGSNVAIGYLDDDPWADLVVGAPAAPLMHGGGGQVFVYHGTSRGLPAIWSRVLTRSGMAYAFSVTAVPGDVDGDGFDDLLVGAPLGQPMDRVGEVHIYPGGNPPGWCAPTLLIGPHWSGFGFPIW